MWLCRRCFEAWRCALEMLATAIENWRQRRAERAVDEDLMQAIEDRWL